MISERTHRKLKRRVDALVKMASDAQQELTAREAEHISEKNVLIQQACDQAMEIRRLQEELKKPIPMRLVCEGCGKLHLDEGEFATKPHHTHSCQFCGLTWRPAVRNTVGVRFLPGFKNNPGPWRVASHGPFIPGLRGGDADAVVAPAEEVRRG